MRRFLNNQGAVTVFVTLLLIPAILVSGTGVDIARLYTAKSTVQDANQLAGNALLTEYDAMLQDIYGLYGVMKTDPELAGMLREYIQASIYGDDPETGNGTFQLFYGSDIESFTVNSAEGKNLGNPEVIRRQIEEYVKLRAPVIIAKQVLSFFEDMKHLSADSGAIKAKMAIDNKIDEIDKLYGQLYDDIQDANPGDGAEQGACDSVNAQFDLIHGQLQEMLNTRTQYEQATDDELKTKLETKYYDLENNIAAYVGGGTVKSGWSDETGSWSSSTYNNGIQKIINSGVDAVNVYKDKLKKVSDDCETVDHEQAKLSGLIDDLEGKLDADCTPKLKTQMQSDVDTYRSLLKYSVKPMGAAMKQQDEVSISAFTDMLKNLNYGKADDAPEGKSASFSNLRQMSNLAGCAIDVNTAQCLSPAEWNSSITLEKLLKTNYRVKVGSNKYLHFEDNAFSSTHNPEFYSELADMFSGNGKAAQEAKQSSETKLSDLLEKIKDMYKGLTFDPEGADSSPYDAETTLSGDDGEWESNDMSKASLEKAVGNDVVNQSMDLLGKASDKINLIVYDTEMFSNYATKSGDKTMSGVSMSTDVNYFFQSEQEFLYHGNSQDAASNLKAVTGLLFVIRFVCNYVSTYLVSTVEQDITAAVAALSVTGPIAVAIAALMRIGYAAGESILDISALRTGHKVPFVKVDKGQWKLSTTNILENGISALSSSSEEGSDEKGLSYSDYLRVFLLFVDGDTLAKRTSELISLNMTNVKGHCNADKGALSGAKHYFLGNAHTDFDISTTVDMRCLFCPCPSRRRASTASFRRKRCRSR